jgi:Skp family chaperone for outer membrane proteins
VTKPNPTAPSASAPSASAPSAPGGSGAEGKFAYVNSAQFSEGVREFKVKLDALNTEFESKRKEMQAMQTELNDLKQKLQTQGSTISPQVRNQLVEDATEKEKLYKRRAEDYEQLWKRRLAEVTQPVYDKIMKLLESYCQQRGIVMVMDGGIAYQAGVLVWAVPASDITDDFMNEYNKAHPVAGK